jgi:hypothetical protein
MLLFVRWAFAIAVKVAKEMAPKQKLFSREHEYGDGDLATNLRALYTPSALRNISITMSVLSVLLYIAQGGHSCKFSWQHADNNPRNCTP